MTEDEVLQTFATRGTQIGGEWFFQPKVCLDLVSECESNGLAVIGIEGFKIDGSEVVPQLDLIADWSNVEVKEWEAFVAEASALSRKFIETISVASGILLNLTIVSEKECS